MRFRWIRFQRYLPVPHDSCGPLKHLLARRGYVELVSVVCILNQMVLRTILSRPNRPPEKLQKPKPIQNHRQKDIENAPLAKCSCPLKGGVRDPRFAGPLYIEDWQFTRSIFNPNGSGLEFKPNGSEG